jgi:2-phospho-L-lactate guanylyltransferase
MNALLIPVKDFADAKKRLALHFPPVARRALAAALFHDFFAVVARARGLNRVFVVSSEPVVLSRSAELGFECVPESGQISESDSVDAASRWCAARGVDLLLRLPVDLPILEPEDIASVFEQKPGAPGMLIVPSRDGDGTNALLRTPPDLYPSRFGPGSFARHLAEAEAVGAQVRIVRNPRIELDIDELEDLHAFAALAPRSTLAGAWLASHSPLPPLETKSSALSTPRQEPAGR